MLWIEFIVSAEILNCLLKEYIFTRIVLGVFEN